MATVQFNERFDASAAEALARRLQAYAADLPDRERAIVLALVYVTVPSLERNALLAADEVLTPGEQTVLAELSGDGS
jgi:hypothetical protein